MKIIINNAKFDLRNKVDADLAKSYLKIRKLTDNILLSQNKRINDLYYNTPTIGNDISNYCDKHGE